MIDIREHYKTTKCATCPISCGCSWGCIRGDDLAEIAELRAALNEALDWIDPTTDPHQEGAGEFVRRMRRAVVCA